MSLDLLIHWDCMWKRDGGSVAKEMREIHPQSLEVKGSVCRPVSWMKSGPCMIDGRIRPNEEGDCER